MDQHFFGVDDHPRWPLRNAFSSSSRELPTLQTVQPNHINIPQPEVSLHELDRLADYVISDSAHSRMVTAQQKTQVSEFTQSSCPSQLPRTLCFLDEDCWDHSWAQLPDACEIESVITGEISECCMRILLAKNVRKNNGLVLIGPSFFKQWMLFPVHDRPIPPKYFDQSLLATNTAQMIVVPAYVDSSTPYLFAISRSALGYSPLWLFSSGCHPIKDETIKALALDFFAWAFQSSGVVSPELKVICSPTPVEPSVSQIHLILTAMAVAEIHRSGQLLHKIDHDQSRILSFRRRVVDQLTSGSSLDSIASISQPEMRKGSKDRANKVNIRFVQFENGRQKKRQRLEAEQPRRSGPLTQTARAGMEVVKKRGGACQRCKTLKKKCDGESPCNQCRSRDSRKTSKWFGPCVRTNLDASIRIGNALGEDLRSERSTRNDIVMENIEEEVTQEVTPAISQEHIEMVSQAFGKVAEREESQDYTMEDRLEEVTRKASPADLEKSLVELEQELINAAVEIYDEFFDIKEEKGGRVWRVGNELNEIDDIDLEKIVRLILAQSAEKFDDYTSSLALRASIISYNIEVSSLLLENTRDGFMLRRNNLHPRLAVERGIVELVQLCLDYGASVTSQDEFGKCLLHVSVENHCVEVSELLVKRIIALTKDDLQYTGWTELHKAIMEGNEDKVRNILESEEDYVCNWNASKDCAGWSIMKWAAWKGNLTIFKLLEEAGADPLGRDMSDGNSLHFAIANSSSAIVRYLINGSEILRHPKDSPNWNVFHYAVEHLKSTKTVQILIDAGFSVNALDPWSRTPLYYACQNGSASIASLLLRYGAQPHSSEIEDLLCHASMSGLTGVLAILLGRLFNPYTSCHSTRSKDKTTSLSLGQPLISAIKGRKVECVQMLLKYGADPWKEKGVMQFAAYSGSTNIVKLLRTRISYHEAIQARNEKGETACDIALKKRFFCIAKLLEHNSPTSSCRCRCCRGLEEDLDLEHIEDIHPSDMVVKLALATETRDVDTVRKLLRLGVSISGTKDSCKETAIHLAARMGYADIVSMLLDAGADYQVIDMLGWVPLHDALRGGSSSVVAALLNAGANVNELTSLGKTALMDAIERGQTECIQVLLEDDGIDVNIPDKKGDTALIYAVRQKGLNQGVLDMLLQAPNGINVDSCLGKMTPVQTAIYYRNDEALGALLRAGADSNKKGKRSKEKLPLHMAVEEGDPILMDILFKAPSIDINAKDPARNGRTALIEASAKARSGIASLLLKQPDIDINAKDSNGRTALIKAIRHSDRDHVSMLLNHPGLDINAKDFDGCTALMEAVYVGSAGVVELLLKFLSIDVNIKNSRGTTAFMMAVHKESLEIVELLLKFPGIYTNAKMPGGFIALTKAVSKNSISIVELLIQFPAIDVNAKDSNGDTALIVAACNNYFEIVKLLLKVPYLNVNITDSEGGSALFFAVSRGYLGVTTDLLEHPLTDVNLHSKRTGRTSLMEASRKNYCDIISLLLNNPKIDINVKDKDGKTALWLALEDREWTVVKMLLEAPHIDAKGYDLSTFDTMRDLGLV